MSSLEEVQRDRRLSGRVRFICAGLIIVYFGLRLCSFIDAHKSRDRGADPMNEDGKDSASPAHFPSFVNLFFFFPYFVGTGIIGLMSTSVNQSFSQSRKLPKIFAAMSLFGGFVLAICALFEVTALGDVGDMQQLSEKCSPRRCDDATDRLECFAQAFLVPGKAEIGEGCGAITCVESAQCVDGICKAKALASFPTTCLDERPWTAAWAFTGPSVKQRSFLSCPAAFDHEKEDGTLTTILNANGGLMEIRLSTDPEKEDPEWNPNDKILELLKQNCKVDEAEEAVFNDWALNWTKERADSIYTSFVAMSVLFGLGALLGFAGCVVGCDLSSARLFAEEQRMLNPGSIELASMAPSAHQLLRPQMGPLQYAAHPQLQMPQHMSQHMSQQLPQAPMLPGMQQAQWRQ